MGLYLRNAIGFFIQLFPCIVMLFFPFSEEAYRFRRKHIFTGIILASTILALAFPALVYCVLNTWPNMDSGVPANLYMVLAILLALAVYVWLVRETLTKKFLVFFSVLFYAAVQYWLVNIIAISVRSVRNSFVYPPMSVYSLLDVLLYLVTMVLLLPIEFFVVLRPLGEFNREIDPKTMKREFFTVILSSAVCFVLMFYCNSLWRTTLGWTVTHLLCLLPIMLFLIIDQAIIYWLVFRESVRRKHDTDHRRAVEIQQQQYEKITKEIENAQRMRHDLRHHYNFLNDMLEKGKLDEIKEYLSQIIDATVKRENEVFCRNMTINGLLQYYIGQARDENISCEVYAKCSEIAIEPVDLTILFGNAIENAIHACRECAENRWITIRVGTVQDSLAIEISNSCKRVHLNRKYQTENGFSPAEAFVSDRDNGGYGLRSITHTAKKYGGSAEFRFNAETETFTTRIRLNAQAEIV